MKIGCESEPLGARREERGRARGPAPEPRPPWCRRPRLRAARLSPGAAFDELDLVAGGVFDERDDGRAVLHRPRLADHLVAESADPLARRPDVVGADRDVAEPV